MKVFGRRAGGFTLVEAMVAMALLLLIFLGVMQTLQLNYSQSKQTRAHMLAQLLAESAVEDLEAHPWGTVEQPPGWEVSGSLWTKEDELESVIQGRKLSIKYTSQIAESPDGALVTVLWQERGRQEKLTFSLPLEPGWKTPPSEQRPSRVAENFHQPGKVDYPSEPSHDYGPTYSKDINIPDPDPANQIDPRLQALAEQIQNLRAEQDPINQQIYQKAQAIAALQAQIDAASDSDTKQQLQNQKAQLEKEQAALQAQSDKLQAEIDDLVKQMNTISST